MIPSSGLYTLNVAIRNVVGLFREGDIRDAR